MAHDLLVEVENMSGAQAYSHVEIWLTDVTCEAAVSASAACDTSGTNALAMRGQQQVKYQGRKWAHDRLFPGKVRKGSTAPQFPRHPAGVGKDAG